jgi:hypothetical protein
MKKTPLILLSLYVVSLGYAAIRLVTQQEEFYLSFLNAAGVFSIFLFIAMLFLILSGYGYFDVFGYTFKKTYMMFSRRHNHENIENKEKYNSYYEYTQFKNSNRLHVRPAFILYVFGFVVVNVILSLMYTYL